MIRAPHPDLRRLYALGSVATRTLDRLDGVMPDLTQLMATPAESTLIDDAVLQALVRAPNISALFEDGTQPTANEDAQQTAHHAGDSVVPLPVRSTQRQSTPQKSSVARSVAKAASTDALQRAHFNPVSLDDSKRSQVRERVAGDDAARRPRVHPGTSHEPGRRLFTAQPAPNEDSNAMSTIAQKKLSVRKLEAKQRIEDIRRELRVEDSACDGLRRRAMKVGAPAAADTRMLVGTPSTDVGALLEEIAASNANVRTDMGSARSSVPSLAASAESSRVANASVSVPALTRVLDRIPERAQSSGRGKLSARRGASQSGAAQRAASALRVAGSGRARSEHSAPDDSVRDFAGAPGEEPTSGLRRLLALHGGAPQGASPTAHTRELPPTPMSGVVASRLRDAELEEALDRLLRREARRQGVDLEGLSG